MTVRIRNEREFYRAVVVLLEFGYHPLIPEGVDYHSEGCPVTSIAISDSHFFGSCWRRIGFEDRETIPVSQLKSYLQLKSL